jgi:hypothetical protein
MTSAHPHQPTRETPLAFAPAPAAAKEGTTRTMLAMAIATAASTGCVSRPSSDFIFPTRFRAQQVVRVDFEDRAETFVAVLDRRPGSMDVTLLEPLFLAPLVRVSRLGRNTQAQWFVELPEGAGGERARAMPERLAGLLDAVYGDAQWTSDAADARGDRCRTRTIPFDAVLSGLPARDSLTCRFPSVIDISFRAGPAKSVRVDTRDVQCGEPTP